MGERIDPDLDRLLRGDPMAELDAIVIGQDSLDDLVAQLPGSVEIRHRYGLICGLAVHGPAWALRELADKPVVKSIEPVRAVYGGPPA